MTKHSFVVVFCGPAVTRNASELRLSDAFDGQGPDVEVRCRIVDVGSKAAAPVLAASPVLSAYAEFVGRVSGYRGIMGLDRAVRRAIDETVEEGGSCRST